MNSFLTKTIIVVLLGVLPKPLLAQTPTDARMQIRQAGGNLFLDYRPGFSSSGATMLHFSGDLSDLYGTASSIFDIAPNTAGPITWDVTPYRTGPRGFFNVTEFPGLTAADFAPDEDALDFDEALPLYNIDTITPIAEPLVTSSAIRVNFRVVDGTTNDPVAITGSVRLGLLDTWDQPPSFPYTLQTDSLPINGGVVDGTVTISTAGNLGGYYIAATDIIPTATIGTRSLTQTLAATGIGRSAVKENPKVPADYAITDARWYYPLPARAPISGSFGEWRPGKTSGGDANGSGRPHLGMDFSVGAGTAVYAAKRGVVTHRFKGKINGKDAGYYMMVTHADGTASKYLHVKPSAGIIVHKVVEAGTQIATVEKFEIPVHLHFELNEQVPVGNSAGGYTKLDFRRPGIAFDPGSENDLFVDIKPVVAGSSDDQDPKIKALYVWDKDPKTTPFSAINTTPILIDASLPTATSGSRYLIAQIVDENFGNRLVPCEFEYYTDDASTKALILRKSFEIRTDRDGGEGDVRRLFQNSSLSFPEFGFVRRVGDSMPDSAEYQFWFKWDTRDYKNSPDGPRQVRIQAIDRANRSVDKTYKFGPKLAALTTPSADTANANGSTFDLEVRSFMGPFPDPNGMVGTPEDLIKLEIVDSGTTASWRANFEENQKDKIEKILYKHDEDSKINLAVSVKPLIIGVPFTGIESVTIRASSSVFPGLLHEIKVPIGEFSLIPAGTFLMGDVTGDGLALGEDPNDHNEFPVHTVNVSEFYMGKYEVKKGLWDEVRDWGVLNEYADLEVGSGETPLHPVGSLTWYSVVKWCNARSEREGLTPCYTVAGNVYRSGNFASVCNWEANGYRLPTEAEWEKAARGGLTGKNFPNGNTISHHDANYEVDIVTDENGNFVRNEFDYDVSLTTGDHPYFSYTAPVGSFSANGYGLHDMAGNILEYCWSDWSEIYSSETQTNPRSLASGQYIVCRGGCWGEAANKARLAYRYGNLPIESDGLIGFRLSRSHVPSN